MYVITRNKPILGFHLRNSESKAAILSILSKGLNSLINLYNLATLSLRLPDVLLTQLISLSVEWTSFRCSHRFFEKQCVTKAVIELLSSRMFKLWLMNILVFEDGLPFRNFNHLIVCNVQDVQFEVLTTESIKMVLFWDVASRSLVKIDVSEVLTACIKFEILALIKIPMSYVLQNFRKILMLRKNVLLPSSGLICIYKFTRLQKT